MSLEVNITKKLNGFTLHANFAARRAVHQRKGHHDGCKDGTVPVHDKLHAEMLHEKGTQRPLCAEQKQ